MAVTGAAGVSLREAPTHVFVGVTRQLKLFLVTAASYRRIREEKVAF